MIVKSRLESGFHAWLRHRDSVPQSNHIGSDPTKGLSALCGSCVSALEGNWWSKCNL